MIPAIAFAARHLLVVPLAIIAGCVLWTIAYVLLLVIAVVWNQGVGGPLAYPAGIVAIAGSAVVVGWGVFAPASAIGAVFCGMFGLPRIAAIPVVFGSAFVLSYLAYWAFIEGLTTQSMPSTWVVLRNFTVFLSVPLGAYWWVTEGPGALIDTFRRRIASRYRAKSDPAAGGEDPPTAL